MTKTAVVTSQLWPQSSTWRGKTTQTNDKKGLFHNWLVFHKSSLTINNLQKNPSKIGKLGEIIVKIIIKKRSCCLYYEFLTGPLGNPTCLKGEINAHAWRGGAIFHGEVIGISDAHQSGRNQKMTTLVERRKWLVHRDPQWLENGIWLV